MSVTAFAGCGRLAARPLAGQRAASLRTNSFGSRRNGQVTRRTPPTQLAAIQVLDPDEELATLKTFPGESGALTI